MRHLKNLTRRAKNNFREDNNYVKASLAKKNLGTRTKTLTKAKIPKRRLI